MSVHRHGRILKLRFGLRRRYELRLIGSQKIGGKLACERIVEKQMPSVLHIVLELLDVSVVGYVCELRIRHDRIVRLQLAGRHFIHRLPFKLQIRRQRLPELFECRRVIAIAAGCVQQADLLFLPCEEGCRSDCQEKGGQAKYRYGGSFFDKFIPRFLYMILAIIALLPPFVNFGSGCAAVPRIRRIRKILPKNRFINKTSSADI